MAKVFVEDNEEIDIICNAIASAYKEVTEFSLQNDAIKNRLKTLIAVINEGLHILPRTLISFINFDFVTLSNNYAKDFKKTKFEPDPEKVRDICNKIFENADILEKITETLSELDKKKVEINDGEYDIFGFTEIEKLVEVDKMLIEKIREAKMSVNQIKDLFEECEKKDVSEEYEIYNMIKDEL
ncbi:hypothetical protein SteCoe_6824 [Stentor coeruleus]|uniref:Uncharacterized protein n=1 Tax=Stentor coeruleus TaxID=5963 RepID=A0A1R2CP15_9CILI|nr:hypothetical protein SteCoe_6824 [Stentor coeruleus]